MELQRLRLLRVERRAPAALALPGSVCPGRRASGAGPATHRRPFRVCQGSPSAAGRLRARAREPLAPLYRLPAGRKVRTEKNRWRRRSRRGDNRKQSRLHSDEKPPLPLPFAACSPRGSPAPQSEEEARRRRGGLAPPPPRSGRGTIESLPLHGGGSRFPQPLQQVDCSLKYAQRPKVFREYLFNRRIR